MAVTVVIVAVVAALAAVRGVVGGLGLCVEGQLGGDLLTVPQNGEGHGVPGFEALLGGGQILHRGDLSIVELGDDVAQLQARLL